MSRGQLQAPTLSAELQRHDLLSLSAGHGLDWSNCCVYHLLENRGPAVQPAASWPVACTASCYAAVSARSVVATDNLAADGPHFLDWKYLAERGCVSMAAVPMFSSSRPVAVLTLASQKVSDKT